MELCQMRCGQCFWVESIPEGALKKRLYQFGFVEGTVVHCRLSKRSIVALEWPGTVIALRRKDIKGLSGRVIA